jgi:hypothetical protein
MTKGVEIFKGDRQFPALKILNFFSSRPSSFIIPVKEEGFINPFLGLLNFFGKSAEML